MTQQLLGAHLQYGLVSTKVRQLNSPCLLSLMTPRNLYLEPGQSLTGAVGLYTLTKQLSQSIWLGRCVYCKLYYYYYYYSTYPFLALTYFTIVINLDILW